MKRENPLETLTLEFADYYATMVEQVVEAIAPARPWWHKELTPDEQVWRWMAQREPIMTWLWDVGPYLGLSSPDDVLANLRTIFVRPLVGIVPDVLRIDERADGLKELVQAAGPNEAARHIRKVEQMVKRRAEAAALMNPIEPVGSGTEVSVPDSVYGGPGEPIGPAALR